MPKTNPSLGGTPNTNNLGRLTFLVDGIFAITITLLVLDLRPPESGSTDFLQTLLAMLPRLLIYFIAFYSIASYWVIHQRMFRYITAVDGTLTWLMIMQMLFITLIPVSTAIVGRFPQQGPALAFFSINSLLHATANWLFCAYAARHQKQFAAQTDARVLGITSQIWLLVGASFLISILLGYWNAYITYASWILLPAIASSWGTARTRLLTKE
ncbi:MAG TPA: TMEM175 family protein [Anaerolineales bacterium]